ncbi:hypothetical protein [Rhizobium chutanense]|uniref:hypothetical protein n=1 Tax=Rhizobium chutanense TaxID=2035448 RepID=UPI001179DF3D|nr:hypothetical protein [Rhizobium chutanense]
MRILGIFDGLGEAIGLYGDLDVPDGDIVHAGDLLVAVDATEAFADRDRAAHDLSKAQLDVSVQSEEVTQALRSSPQHCRCRIDERRRKASVEIAFTQDERIASHIESSYLFIENF